jgi:predicted nuclease with TOPRIM domain
MREQIERRLEELRREYEAGTKLLGELETKQAHVRATLTRISGAIQVLEEELSKAGQPGNRGIKAGAVDGPLGDADALPPSVQ